MMGKTHALIGGVSWLASMAIFARSHVNMASFSELAGGYGLAVVGALAPDIDSPRSLITKSLGPVTGALSWVIRQIGAIGDPHGGYMRGHRRITHSLIGFVLAMLPFVLGVEFWHLQPWVFYAFMVGWVSHVAADMATVMGCPLLYPRDTCYGLHMLKTGSIWETHVIRPVTALLNVVLFIASTGVFKR